MSAAHSSHRSRLFGDWSLRSCARHGHVTYRPEETEIAARLHVTTPAGEAWRCLRCGDFTIGDPSSSGPANEAPEVMRGKALRDLWIIRLLAVEKFIRSAFLFLLAWGAWKFHAIQQSFAEFLNKEIPLLKPAAHAIGWNIDSSWVIVTMKQLVAVNPGLLLWTVLGLTLYGALQASEAIGLWFARRWGEYLAVVGTSAFIPLEIYEICNHISPLKVTVLLVNLAAVTWLVLSKRLFGARGGRRAHDAQHRQDSLLAVETAAELPHH
jgi:uncharacterized membrane protein (DUF2068 family)